MHACSRAVENVRLEGRMLGPGHARRLSTLSEHLWAKIGRADLRNSVSVDLRGKGLTASDMDAIAVELAANQELESLDLAHNGFGADGAGAVANILRACPTLASLIVDSNSLRAGAAEVAEPLAAHGALRKLGHSRIPKFLQNSVHVD